MMAKYADSSKKHSKQPICHCHLLYRLFVGLFFKFALAESIILRVFLLVENKGKLKKDYDHDDKNRENKIVLPKKHCNAEMRSVHLQKCRTVLSCFYTVPSSHPSLHPSNHQTIQNKSSNHPSYPGPIIESSRTNHPTTQSPKHSEPIIPSLN